jgi:methylthioribose-1-phosphate isomerase
LVVARECDDARGPAVEIIDQTRLPHELVVRELVSLDCAARAISEMWVRGAPLVGVTAAYGLALGLLQGASDADLAGYAATLRATRPTAVNLAWALERMLVHLRPLPASTRASAAFELAARLADEDVEVNLAIGRYGLALLQSLQERALRKRSHLAILTHCNAGWLATVDRGTATAPIYAARDAGLPLHVFVDETRPRNQGASLTAWELQQEAIAHTLIVDNAGGHLMQHGEVDVCMVGTDRTTREGDVCNKIGTYLKALAAHDNGVPFYVAAPTSSIDWSIAAKDIPIEERASDEVTHLAGVTDAGEFTRVRVTGPGTTARNPGFDVTPARLITGFITEFGVFRPDELPLLRRRLEAR